MFELRLFQAPRAWLFSLTTLMLSLVLFSPASSLATEAAQPKIGPRAAAQMQALKSIKTTKSPQQNKIDSRLYLGLLHQRSDSRLATLTDFRFVKPEADGRVAVNILLSGADGVKPVLNLLDSLGDVVKAKSYAYHTVTARVAMQNLDALAAIAQVRTIRQAIPGMTQAVNTSEGDLTHGANEARGYFGVTGAGVKVCVLSDGVNSLATLQASGDLPAVVDVLPGQAGSGDEGSAMLEIVHDLAPGAALGFATGTTDEATFATNIASLVTAGCNVIVDDVDYLDESPFEDGPLAQAVNAATAAGVIYFSAAGDNGNKDAATSSTWEGDFLATAASDPAPLAGANLHNFGDGGNSILVTAAGTPVLTWAEHYDLSGGVASTDYDLYDMDGGLTTIFDASTNTQDGVGGDDRAIEIISGGTFAGERLLIDKFAAGITSSTPMFNLAVLKGKLDATLATSGATRGHSSAVDAFSVAATPVATSADGISPAGPYPGLFTAANVSESFTSDGPRRILLDTTGAELTPGNRTSTGGVVRQKPDITAADGVATASPGYSPFFGTSAAAPHAAAIAALIKSAVPAATPAQIRTALISSAIDIQTAGVDRDTGAGIVMAHAALQAAGAAQAVSLSAGTAVKTQIIGDGDAYVEPNETWALSVPLTNSGAMSATAVSAVLSSATPGVSIVSGTSAYADIAPAGTANNTTPFAFKLGSTAPCGGMLDFTLTVTYAESATPVTFNFSIQSGAPGAPITTTYAGTVVPIPDAADLSGSAPGAPAIAPLAISGISGNIYSTVLSIDGSACSATAGSTTVGIDHSFINDLRITLTSPAATSVLVVNNTDGSGNNMCQTILDDTGATSIQSVVTAQAPFTGTFAPNSPLSAMRGQNPNGTWNLQAQDFFASDTGNIRAFSVTVTPAVCNAPVAAPVITGSMAILSGSKVAGGSVIYTIVLTNSGNATQLDNAGAEFTDLLPAGLIVGTPTANTGTISAPGINPVTWNGFIPANNSMSITIPATIATGTAGQTITNQGTINVDADGNGTNETAVLTDDPSVGGTADPTSFVVLTPTFPLINATKQIVSGDQTSGGSVTYVVTLTNSGTGTQPDNAGDEFTDVLPAQLSAGTVTASSGTASVVGSTVSWNGVIPAGGGVNIIIPATIAANTTGQTITNQGTVHFDANSVGINESTTTTDDPSLPGTNDPTSFVVFAPPAPVISATKTISGGNRLAGGTVIYTITLTNSGTAAQPDNAGNEFSDMLPAGLTVGTPTASSGTVSAASVNPVTWNGSIPAGGSITITIPATIAAGTAGQIISNQGSASYDADGNGSNETTVLTSAPGNTGQPTVFTVAALAQAPSAIPASSIWTLTLTSLMLFGTAAMLHLRRRREDRMIGLS
ncbi:S8 family serine peptidase [Pseudolysobacter antarcticus]|nr:S8 family serine peptidase [Pseudolysobacter antarcticus]